MVPEHQRLEFVLDAILNGDFEALLIRERQPCITEFQDALAASMRWELHLDDKPRIIRKLIRATVNIVDNWPFNVRQFIMRNHWTGEIDSFLAANPTWEQYEQCRCRTFHIVRRDRRLLTRYDLDCTSLQVESILRYHRIEMEEDRVLQYAIPSLEGALEYLQN